ncbi:MAG: hypothetical protein A2046_15960 [Bacteroidetes bacterium GWA2_30_7]|nr:MAG: hypothetical protein A2046_15960 [Bacteroidetes bacterium GWA2_30_7]
MKKLHLDNYEKEILKSVENNEWKSIGEFEKDTYKKQLKNLLDELKNNDITPEEVTKEVELVRSKRFKSKNR